jgi:hypothetical protein
MNAGIKKYIGWLLVVVAILIAGVLGVSYPVPAPPDVGALSRMRGAIYCDGSETYCVQAVRGIIKGSAEGTVVYNTFHTITIAEINAGHTVVTVPASRQFRLVDVKAVAYGGACGAVTTVDLLAGATKLATYAQANLTQSNTMSIGSTGVTVLADGASFAAQTADQDITVGKTGADVTTCTGVKLVLSYALE